jgi:putative flavoprotein involved in K+ transport
VELDDQEVKDMAATPTTLAGVTERVETVVVGGGQAGLSVGYHLARHDRSFLILDQGERVGDAWRNRWDSLRLFTPARHNGLDGLPFPAARHSFPTKDEMATYLEEYATRFELPVRTGVRVDRLARADDGFLLTAGERRYAADNVVVAMSNWQRPRRPSFAGDIDPAVVQVNSGEYRNPGQLREGTVLVVGAGNSGAEIALELAGEHETLLSGRDTGHIPFDIEGAAARYVLADLVLRLAFHRVLTVRTPVGRKVRSKVLSHGMPLIRTAPKDLASAGVRRVPRVVGVQDGLPVLEDGHVLEVGNVVWCTGFDPGFSWIDLPVLEQGEPKHERGIAQDVPGLYFVGLAFLYAASSSMLHGVGRDAQRVAGSIAARAEAPSGRRARLGGEGVYAPADRALRHGVRTKESES